MLVSVLGFPVALIIAWAFEMTPEGMKRDEEIAPNEYIPHWSTRKFAALIVTIAMLATGVLLFQLVRSKPTLGPELLPLQRPLKSRSQFCRCLTKAVIRATSIFRMGCRRN